jgi:hypothetical protein
MFIVLIILVVVAIFGLLFYKAYDKATSSSSYETFEVRIDCEDYRLASLEWWEMMNFEVNGNIATIKDISYDITTQKVCMEFDGINICNEACRKEGFSAVAWEPNNEVGQHVCVCQK